MVGPRSHQQFPLLDSLRALAALSILVVHVAILTGADKASGYGRFVSHLDIGVPFFFLLSAFLLYRPFLAARVEGMPRASFSEYAKRRFFRIMPAYWLVLTVAAIVPGFAGTFSGNWWAYYGLLQNYPIYTPDSACVMQPYECGIPIAWSLTVEVGFYMLLPLLVLFISWLGARLPRVPWLRLELTAFAAISAVSFAVMSTSPTTNLRVVLFFSPIGRGWWFALGLMLAALSVWAVQRDREPRFVAAIRSHPGRLVAAALTLYVLSTYLMSDSRLAFPTADRTTFLLQFALVGVIAALLLAPAVFGTDGGGIYRAALAHPLLSWLGLVSYGIFLWQFPVLIGLLDLGLIDGMSRSVSFAVLLPATVAGTVACAAFSYYALERPLMRWSRRDRGARRRWQRPATSE